MKNSQVWVVQGFSLSRKFLPISLKREFWHVNELEKVIFIIHFIINNLEDRGLSSQSIGLRLHSVCRGRPRILCDDWFRIKLYLYSTYHTMTATPSASQLGKGEYLKHGKRNIEKVLKAPVSPSLLGLFGPIHTKLTLFRCINTSFSQC